MKARVSDGCLRDSRTIYHPRPRRPSTLSRYETYPQLWLPRLRRPRTDSCTGTHRAAANVARPLWAQRRRQLRRNEPPGTNVGPRSGSARTAGPSSKSMDGAPAQGRAFEPGASESANSRASRMRRRPNQFGLPCGTMARLGRGEPCSDAGADPFGSSKLNRTAPSGKVSLLASTDTSIRLANLTFGRSARAR